MSRWLFGLKVMLVIGVGLGLGSGDLWAEWSLVSQALPESDIRYVIADPVAPVCLYAASVRRLYRSVDGGGVWKRMMSLRSTSDSINGIYFDPVTRSRLYIATNKGIRVSEDGGAKWGPFYAGLSGGSKEVNAMATHPQKPDQLLVGTSEGLLEVHKGTHEARRIASAPRIAIYAIWSDSRSVIILTTAKGIWKSVDGGGHWLRVYANRESEKTDEETLEQFQIEELSLKPGFSNIVQISSGHLFAGSRRGLLEGGPQKDVWATGNESSFAEPVRYLAASQNTLYAATDRGVFAKKESEQSFNSMSDGLGSLSVNMLHFNENDNSLYAATTKGVYRFAYPEMQVVHADSVDTKETVKTIPLNAQDVLKRFAGEPTVRQIQLAAIRYAEVHPEKIQAWRGAAMKKAMLPTISLRSDVSRDENIDLDRGGTNDPDRFISGPEEKSTDWSVGASWDLGELIWNDDQTSIDTRSKLMVELRDDVLTEVTHLYYERRRLQVDLFLAPPSSVPLAIEKDLKLQELTASIDALTGGYLTERSGGR